MSIASIEHSPTWYHIHKLEIELLPESAESHNNFGLCYFNQGGVEEAGTALDLEELEEVQINRQRILESTDSNPSLEPALVAASDLILTTRAN